MTDPVGLSPKVLDEIKNILAFQLKLKNQLAVYAFGSRSKNTPRQYSDLDLWIEADPDLSVREITELREAFENSDIPIYVDIVTPSTCLPAYLPQIQSEKKRWF